MKRKLALVLVVALILSLGTFSTVSYAADAAEDITVYTGEQFVTALTANKGATITIEGTEDCADGTKGIVIPNTYQTLSGYNGNIIGVENCNTIQLAETSGNEKSLFGRLSSGNLNISNINIVGAGSGGKGTITTGYVYTTSSSAVNTTSPLICYANGVKVTLNKVTNYVDVDTGKDVIGGLIGFVRNGSVEINDCKNYGDMTSTNRAGGILAYGRGTSTVVTIRHSSNHGKITGGAIGGIYGSDFGTSDYIDITIENCYNDGVILYGTSGSVGGIAGNAYSADISKCYNAGTVTGYKFAGGIVGNSSSSSTVYSTVSNCFNVGNISYAISASNVSSGTVCGIARGSYGVVENCYNLGDLTSMNGVERIYPISNSKTAGCVNNYYTNTEKSDSSTIGTPTTIEGLATDFLSNLNPAEGEPVWYYTEDSSYNYSLPQIIGNEFVNDKNNDWYIAPEEEITVGPASDDILFAKGEDMLFSEEDLGEDLTFENENSSADAKGKNHCEGAFGILFYGNKLKNGNTYYVRPYVLFNGTYTYGAPTSFVFSAE